MTTKQNSRRFFVKNLSVMPNFNLGLSKSLTYASTGIRTREHPVGRAACLPLSFSNSTASSRLSELTSMQRRGNTLQAPENRLGITHCRLLGSVEIIHCTPPGSVGLKLCRSLDNVGLRHCSCWQIRGNTWYAPGQGRSNTLHVPIQGRSKTLHVPGQGRGKKYCVPQGRVGVKILQTCGQCRIEMLSTNGLGYFRSWG